MALNSYHQKRNFKKTPEPKGKMLHKKNSHSYVIQKHTASHLHYDFRLELNGVLLSWAIPKGPCLDPKVKRLAIQVEDHPIEYGDFEGTIPKGQYGAGTVLLWDKGTWISLDDNPTKAYQSANLTFQLKGKKLKGKWKLIRIKKDNKNWLLMKLKDKYAISIKQFDIIVDKPNSVTGKKFLHINKKTETPLPINLNKQIFPRSIHPQLATLVNQPPAGKKWIYEIKFDGYRLIIFKKNNKVKIMTRNQHDWTNKFPILVKAIKKISSKNFILDGEVVVLDKQQRSNFQLLQNAITKNKTGFIYYIFDLIYFDHYNLTHLPLLTRKKILSQILSKQKSKNLRYSDHIVGSGKKIFQESCKLGLEGIIAKNIHSIYAQTRNKDWLKIKCSKRQEFVVGGFHLSKNRKYFRSLILGTFNNNNKLIYHGDVGTGFTEASLREIYTLLKQHITSSMPFIKKPINSKDATWLKPVLVVEVEFTEWTADNTLRHPSFKGIRIDKPAKNIKKEISNDQKK